MLHVLHVDVAKVYLDVALLHLLQVFYLDVASWKRDLNVLCNIKLMLRRVSSSSSTDDKQLFSIFFLMLQIVVFMLQKFFFYVVNVII